MEQLAEAALEASGQTVASHVSHALDSADRTGEGVAAFLDIAARTVDGDPCAGGPIAPSALESPILSPRLRATAARCFDEWESLVAKRLRADEWPGESVAETASAALALIEGALLLARVSGHEAHLTNARRAAQALLVRRP
jgi:TetR/AcrR family transcriptional repressor of lmrAB and yxaGH operons